MNFESWISYRYLIASKGRFLTFLNIVSILGVAIGVMALIVVIGVMTGFGNNLREKIIGTTPHLMIEKESGIRDYRSLVDRVTQVAGVEGASAFIQGNIFIEEGGQATGVALRGIDPARENAVTRVSQYLVTGGMSDLKKQTVVIGQELARYYGYQVGDTVTLITPGSGIEGGKWKYDLTVSGIFKTGMADFDMNLVIVHLNTAQQIFGLPPDVVTGVGVRSENPYQAEAVKARLYEMLGFEYLIRSWIDINRNLFEALFLEKWGLFLILALMVMVASFNIVSTMVVTVMSKVHDIGILQSIGVPKRSIRRIFKKQGFYIGTMGTLAGVVAGVGISYILRNYVKVPEQIYSIDHVPIELQPFDMAVIIISALLISYAATLYPAAKAAKLEPVEALRYE